MEATPDKSWLLFFIAILIVAVFGLMGALGSIIALSIAPPTYSMPLSPCATENPVGSKVGTAEGCTYFFIFGDASNATILNACKNSGITKISTVEYYMHNHMFIWQTWTCKISGE